MIDNFLSVLNSAFLFRALLFSVNSRNSAALSLQHFVLTDSSFELKTDRRAARSLCMNVINFFLKTVEELMRVWCRSDFEELFTAYKEYTGVYIPVGLSQPCSCNPQDVN
jgi:hypothetical protein